MTVSESKTVTVALVGANGTLGAYVFYQLLHSPLVASVRTLSRSAAPPPGGQAANHRVYQYDSVDSIVAALDGIDVLVSCMGIGPNYHVTKNNLVLAAAKAGVKAYVPSDFGLDRDQVSATYEHAIWTEKEEHQRFAREHGLRNVVVYNGFFMENPFGVFGPWHGFDLKNHTWTLAGDGTKPFGITSKVDIGKALAQLAHVLVHDPDRLQGKDSIRICGHNITPAETLDVLNKTYCGGKAPDIKLKLITDEAGLKGIAKSLHIVPYDDVSASRLGDDFDQTFADEVAVLVFRALGSGHIDMAVNDNELLNPNESLWKWKRFEDYDADTAHKTFF